MADRHCPCRYPVLYAEEHGGRMKWKEIKLNIIMWLIIIFLGPFYLILELLTELQNRCKITKPHF